MCGLYRILDNQIIKKGIWQLLILLLLGQVENTLLPVVSYQRRKEYRVSQMSMLERAATWCSPYMYYCAYVSAPAAADTELLKAEQTAETEQIIETGQNMETEQVMNETDEASEEILTSDYLDEMLRENADSMEPEESLFCEQTLPRITYDWSKEWTQDDLQSEFFAVDSSTSMKSEYLNLDQLLGKDLTVQDDGTDDIQILIYHTHGSEAFADSIEGDPSTTILGAGEKLASLLEEYGFRVLHHTGIYDEHRDDAYDAALPAIEKILQENPSIQVVIDLHRDEMSGDRKLVMDLQGRPTARFMFFNGLSYSRKKGAIEYLQNPYIEDNLAFSFQAQVAANEYYPGIARKIYLKAYRYNMHLCPKSMLIELGAQNNTVEEIQNACEPLAHILAIVLGKMV